MATTGALLGLGSAAAGAAPRSGMAAGTADDLFAMARLRSYKNRRSSSWDRTGANADWVRVEPGQAAVLFDAEGAGVITHLWFTISSADPMHLKNLVLRAWWDGEASPSVEVPIGDFFGLGFGEYFLYESELLVVAPMKALNAYFQMPFSKAARMTLTNEGKQPTSNLYFAIDYVALESLPEDLGRFHAQYRQAAPCKGWTNNWTRNNEPLVNDRKNLIRGLGITILLGMTFTSLQALEYSNAPFHFAGGGIYPSVFFLATGFHGFHVIVGTTFLAVCWFRARAGGFTPQRHFGFEAAAWYWHFVDVVWLFLFCFIYVWGAGPPPVE